MCKCVCVQPVIKSHLDNCIQLIDSTHTQTQTHIHAAAEIDAASFSPTFIMGSGSESTGLNSTYKNAPLLEGKSYSCFLRAFPKSSVLLARGRRQVTGGEELRQYAIFSSTTFMEVQKTGVCPVVLGLCVSMICASCPVYSLPGPHLHVHPLLFPCFYSLPLSLPSPSIYLLPILPSPPPPPPPTLH